MDQSTAQLKMTVYASLMAALTAAGAFMAIPIGPVPIVLQNFFVFLTGLLLGSRWGVASVAVYLLAGVCGLPVFAGGTGGIGRILGPTGGYLMGYLPAVFIIGLISERAGQKIFLHIGAVVIGAFLVYAAGVPWLKMVTGMPWSKAAMAGMIPFIPGDAVKVVAAVLVARTLHPVLGISMNVDTE
jgi:biotin transport system substrate-specific component